MNKGTKRFFEGTRHTYVKVYDKCKYELDSQVIATVDYERTVEYGIFSSKDFKEGALAGIEPDPHDEYLKLWNADGTTATFRNSFVDLFLF